MQGIFLRSDIPPLSFTIQAVNPKGDGECSFSFVADETNDSFTLDGLGYHNNWKIFWNDPIESLDWVDVCRYIRVYSKGREEDVSVAAFRFSFQAPKVEILLCPRALPGRRGVHREFGFTDVVTQLSATDLSGSMISTESVAQFNCIIQYISLSYTDPFDHCPLTFAEGSAVDIFYQRKLSSSGQMIDDWIRDIKSNALKNECYAALIEDGQNLSQDILIQTRTGIRVLMTNYLLYDLKYIWNAAARDEMDYYFKIENCLLNTLSVKQIECTQILCISQNGCEGFSLEYKKPRLLQFSYGRSDTESFWTDPVDVRIFLIDNFTYYYDLMPSISIYVGLFESSRVQNCYVIRQNDHQS